MTPDNQVLVADRADGAFQGVMEELGQLGFQVIWVPTLSAALEFVLASPRLTLVIASAAAAHDGGQEFLEQLKKVRPSLPVIWGAGSEPVLLDDSCPSPNSRIPEPIRPGALRRAVSGLLAEHFYPKVISDTLKSGALEVLNRMGEFRVEGGEFLIANQTELSDLSAIISFSGDASGHLMVGATNEDAKFLYHRFVPESRFVPVDRLEDFGGELCNQILGRLNALFALHTLSVQQTTPIFIRAAGSRMRYPGRHPSFGVLLTQGQARLSIEYYLAAFDRTKLFQVTTHPVLALGEIRYL